MSDFSNLEKRLGYTFRDKSLLELALTHSTYANRYGGEDNERLEYLGDAVLELVVSEKQYLFGNESAGKMSEERQNLVSKAALLSAVKELEIKPCMRFVGREENIGAKSVSSLFETVTAAIYLDGGYEKAKQFVWKNIKNAGKENYKKQLQEAEKGQLEPVYEQVKKEGKDNAPHFVCRVRVKDGTSAVGEGGDVTSAEQQAAKNLLEKLGQRI